MTATAAVTLQPKTVNLIFQSSPGGLQLAAGPTTARAPFTITAIQKATLQLTAPTPQRIRNKNYTFASWSDGGGQTQTITAPATATTYTAGYQRVR
jgi:hypothetical protein